MSLSVRMLGWGIPPNVTGGLDTHVGYLVSELVDAGIDIELIFPAEFAPAEPRDELVPVETGDGDVRGRVDKLTDTFVERSRDADIIHTHDWFGYNPGRQAAAESDAVWVSSFHSLSSDRNIDPPQLEVETEHKLAQEADHLISVSQLVADDVKRLYDADSTVIHNGFASVEPSGKDVRSELGIEGPMVLFVGRHTDQKGISHLLYAMKKLRRSDVTLVVGGTGHQTEQLKEFASILGIEDQVIFAGYIPSKTLGDYYAASDVFVSPSLAEPFGLTITEALAAGSHVVATKSGVRETLPDGLLIEVTPDSESIVAGIEEALARTEPPQYEERTWKQMTGEIIAVYEELAETA